MAKDKVQYDPFTPKGEPRKEPLAARVLGENRVEPVLVETADGRSFTKMVRFIDLMVLSPSTGELFPATKEEQYIDWRFSTLEGLDVLDGVALSIEQVVQMKGEQQAARISGVRTPDGTALDLDAALDAASA